MKKIKIKIENLKKIKKNERKGKRGEEGKRIQDRLFNIIIEDSMFFLQMC